MARLRPVDDSELNVDGAVTENIDGASELEGRQVSEAMSTFISEVNQDLPTQKYGEDSNRISEVAIGTHIRAKRFKQKGEEKVKRS